MYNKDWSGVLHITQSIGEPISGSGGGGSGGMSINIIIILTITTTTLLYYTTYLPVRNSLNLSSP